MMRSLRMPSPAAASIARSSSSRLSSSGQFDTPSAGMQYRQRRLQRSVTDTRRYVNCPAVAIQHAETPFFFEKLLFIIYLFHRYCNPQPKLIK